MATKYVKGRLYTLKLGELRDDPEQARQFMDPVGLNELAASIGKHGVLTPILFRQDAQGLLFIVAGHRRVKAAQKAGLAEIAGIFTAGDTHLQGFVENLQREGLLPIDEAEEMDALMKEYNMNPYQLAEALGRPTSTVYETMSLNRLPADVRDAGRSNPHITKSLLLKAAREKTEATMRRKFQQLMKKADREEQSPLRKERKAPVRSLIVKLDELTGRLGVFPWRECTEDDRSDLANAAAGIRRAAAVLLADMGVTPAEQEPETPGRGNLS